MNKKCKNSRQKLKPININGEIINKDNYLNYWKNEFKEVFHDMCEREGRVKLNPSATKGIEDYILRFTLTAFIRSRLLPSIKKSLWIIAIDKAGKSKTKPIDIGIICKKPDGLHWKASEKQFEVLCANKSNPVITISDFGEKLGRINSKYYMKCSFQILKNVIETMVHTKHQKIGKNENLDNYKRGRAEFGIFQRKLDLKLKEYFGKIFKLYYRSKK